MSRVAAAAAVLAGVGVALVAVGVGLWSVPAGLVTGGVEMVAAGYVASYLDARARVVRPRPVESGRRAA